MYTNVDRRMSGVGKIRALVQIERGIAVAQHQSAHSASLEFLPQLPRLSSNHGVHRRTELHHQRGRIRFIHLRRKMDAHIADEQTACGLVESDWAAEKTR